MNKKKLIFQKYFKISKFQNIITFDSENIFKQKLGFGLLRMTPNRLTCSSNRSQLFHALLPVQRFFLGGKKHKN